MLQDAVSSLYSHRSVLSWYMYDHALSMLQDAASRVAELEGSNKRVLQELADFKAESKELRNQDLTIKRLEAQLGQLKAQLQNKVLCSMSHIWS